MKIRKIVSGFGLRNQIRAERTNGGGRKAGAQFLVNHEAFASTHYRFFTKAACTPLAASCMKYISDSPRLNRNSMKT